MLSNYSSKNATNLHFRFMIVQICTKTQPDMTTTMKITMKMTDITNQNVFMMMVIF